MKKCDELRSIAVLICYMGKLPWYFDYFAYSCKFNPTIDFFVLTDDISYSKQLPDNLKLVITNLSEVSELASMRLSFGVTIKNSYKLCDFKPTYGVVFSHILNQYDFWACGDIDVIYGNIRDFITNDLLENHDLISVRPDWIPGCFILFKNTKKVNSLYTHSKDYQKVLMSDIHYCFDETNFAHDAFTDGKVYHEVHTEIESMMHVIKRLEEAGYIKPYWDLFIIEGIPGKLKWKRGKLTYRNKYEILLYHLIRLKKNFTPKTIPTHIPDSFSISPTRIYHK
jgi:hypothetical protein